MGMGSVKVDWNKCSGEGTCVATCPVAVFELQKKGDKTVAVAVAEDQCIVCRACEVQCPESAITVTE